MSRTPMKLILTQEVSGLGAPGDVVDVAAGYGRNYLIPRGFAMRWTRGAEKQIDLIKRARSAREIRSLEDAKAVAAQLEGLHGADAAARGRQRPAVRLGRPGRHRRAPCARPAARNSTVAGSRSATRSRPSARTRCGSGCTPRSARPSTSRSSPASLRLRPQAACAARRHAAPSYPAAWARCLRPVRAASARLGRRAVARSAGAAAGPAPGRCSRTMAQTAAIRAARSAGIRALADRRRAGRWPRPRAGERPRLSNTPSKTIRSAVSCGPACRQSPVMPQVLPTPAPVDTTLWITDPAKIHREVFLPHSRWITFPLLTGPYLCDSGQPSPQVCPQAAHNVGGVSAHACPQAVHRATWCPARRAAKLSEPSARTVSGNRQKCVRVPSRGSTATRTGRCAR